MKSKLLKCLVSAAALAVAGVSANAETVLKLGSVAPSGSPWAKWITDVAAHVEEISGGELKLDLILDAQIGDEQTILRQAVKGRIEIAYVSNIPLTLLAKEMALISTPHLWDSIEQGSCAAHKHMLGYCHGTRSAA